MYRNLEAEMVRHGITRAMIAELLGLRKATVTSKLSRKNSLKYEEAKIIKDKFFPEMNIEFLFEFTERNLNSAA